MPQDIWLKILRLLPAELAHRMMIRLLQTYGALPVHRLQTETGAISCLDLSFNHRLGIAAGMDKDAEAYLGLMKLGFGFVEVGTVTPKPQLGNPQPRLFRLPKDHAVINRMGFNNRGIDALLRRVQKANHLPRRVLGINVGPNKTSIEPIEDFLAAFHLVAPYADYLTINLSSPNTPGLRDLQQGDAMLELLTSLQQARAELAETLNIHPPVLLKISPDWHDLGDFYHILDQGVARGFDGFILTNTTVDRPETLKSKASCEVGGLSGEPLFVSSTLLLAAAYRHLQGEVSLVGVGGISSIADAMVKITAGASLLQVYSGLSYLPRKILAIFQHEKDSLVVPPVLYTSDNDALIGSQSQGLRDEKSIVDTRVSIGGMLKTY